MLIKSLNTGRIFDTTLSQEITLSLDNPLFADDRMPAPVSTGIEFPLSSSNKIEFGFLDTLMLPPAVSKIPASIIVGGLEIIIGELQFDDFSDNSLKYTFVGACSIDLFKGKIHETECVNYEGLKMSTFVQNARKGSYRDVGLPLVVRKTNSAKVEYKTEAGDPECSIIDKYANYLYSDEPYIIPALKVGYILEKMHPLLLMPSEIADYTDQMAIIGTFKPEGWQDERHGIPSYRSVRGGPMYMDAFNAADALPDMTKSDFLKNLLKMFCATLFPDGSSYKIRTNKSIINDRSFVDWTEKVMDVYALIAGEESGYSMSYSNPKQTFNATKEDDLGQDEEFLPSVQTASNYEDMISKFRASENYINVKIASTGNIYSGRVVKAQLYYSYQFGIYGPPIYNSLKTAIPTIDVVYQANTDKVDITTTSDSSNKYNNSIELTCPKCIPANVATPIRLQSTDAQVTLRTVAPVVELPTVGDSRPTDVYIGLLIQNNFLDQGNYFTPPIPYIDGGSEVSNRRFSIALSGEGGLYEKFHKDFAAWLTKKKDSVKIDAILSPADIASLRLWQKIMIHNRLFIIKTIELTISNKSNFIYAAAELVDVSYSLETV